MKLALFESWDLPNPEYPGRVRGVGGLVPMTKIFGKGSIRRTRTKKTSEEEINARVDQRVEERVKGIEDRLRQELKAELAIMLRQTMGEPEKTCTPTVIQSSCQSVKQYANFSGFTEEAELSCKLLANVNGNTLIVAMGTIHVPVLPGGTIHNRPMPPDHTRVTVDDIQDADFLEIPLPVPNGEQLTIASVLGSFTAWPMSMIVIGSDEVRAHKLIRRVHLFRKKRIGEKAN